MTHKVKNRQIHENFFSVAKKKHVFNMFLILAQNIDVGTSKHKIRTINTAANPELLGCMMVQTFIKFTITKAFPYNIWRFFQM